MIRSSFFRTPAIVAAAGMAMLAQAHDAQAATPGLGGTWQVHVQLVDCASTMPVGPAFTSLLSFAGNGTEAEVTNNPALAPGQRSTGFGAWGPASGGHYHLNTYALILFSSTTGPHPIAAGSQHIEQVIVLNGNSWTSTAAIQFFDTTGAQVGAGCATASAARLT